MKAPPGWYTYDDLVNLGPFCKRQWRRLVAVGRLRSRRLGHRTVLISQRSVNAYLGNA